MLRTVKQVMEANDLPVTYYDVTLVPMYSPDEYNRRYSSYESVRNGLLESGPVAAAQVE